MSNSTATVEITYSYKDVPTIWKFSQSNARWRLLMGPVGCVDGDTEFLTTTGWKKISDYEEGDLVGQVNVKEDHVEIEYVKPNAYIKSYLPSGFYHFKTDYVDNMLSPDHTMYILKNFYGFPQYGNASAVEAVYLSSQEDIGLMHIHNFAEDKIKIFPKDIVPYRVSYEDITFIKSPIEDPLIQYCFTLPAKKFLARRNENIFITGNSGKSSGCVWEIIRRGLAQKPSPVDGIRRTRWVVIRNHYRQLTDTTIKTFFDWFPPSQFGEWRVAEHVYKITAFDKTNIEILFRALDSPEHVSNLLSLEVTGAWINEAKEVAEEIADMLDTRIGRYPSKKHGGASWMGIFMDTNPPDEESWLYKKFEINKTSNCEIFKQPSGLSPEAENIANLPEGYYQNLCEGKSPDFIKVFIHGQYGTIKSGRAVYSGYNDNLHVSKQPIKPIPSEPIIVGFDFGLSVAAVFCQLTANGRFFVLDELVSEGVGIRTFLQNRFTPLVNTKYRGYKIVGYGDPAGVQRAQTDERTCFDEIAEFGYKITPARTNALAARIDAVEFLLNRIVEGEIGFQLDPSCRVLRRGFIGGYHFKEVGGFSHKYNELPEKNKYSHVHDALQYAALYVSERFKSQKRAVLLVPRKKYQPATLAGY